MFDVWIIRDCVLCLDYEGLSFMCGSESLGWCSIDWWIANRKHVWMKGCCLLAGQRPGHMYLRDRSAQTFTRTAMLR